MKRGYSVFAVPWFSRNTTCLFLWMEFLSYESALLHFTLSNMSCHHNSWSCIYCVLFILMQINFLESFYLFDVLWQERDFSRFFCQFAIVQQVYTRRWVFLLWKEMCGYLSELIVFLLCGVFFSGVFQPLCSSIFSGCVSCANGTVWVSQQQGLMPWQEGNGIPPPPFYFPIL